MIAFETSHCAEVARDSRPEVRGPRLGPRATRVAICGILLGLLHGVVGAADVTKSVRVTGIASLIEGDVASAFERAKSAALQEAVEEGLGVLVSSSTRVRNFELIDDHVLAKTSGYVSQFSLVERKAVGEDTYEVTIDAVVDLGNLEEDLSGLALLMEETGRPRIWCGGREYLLSENGDRTPLDWRLAESELVRAMSALQGDLFSLLRGGATPDPSYLGADTSDQGDSRQGAATPDTTRAADIAVTAEVTVRRGPDVRIPFSRSGQSVSQTGLVTAVADVQVRALWTDTGETINTLSSEGRGADADFIKAGRKVARQVLAELAEAIARDVISDLREKAYSGRIIQLMVRADPQQLRRFEESLPLRISGVEKLYPRSYESGLATYDVRAASAAFDVARQLSARGLADLGVEILQVSANSLKLKLSN